MAEGAAEKKAQPGGDRPGHRHQGGNPEEPAPFYHAPPHSVEAEQAVLGGLVLDSSKLPAVVELIGGAAFYLHQHRIIFEAIEALAKEGQPADLVLLANELERRDRLEEAGGNGYLADLANNTPTAANVAHYASVVQERARQRWVMQAAEDLRSGAFNQGDLNEVVSDALRRLETIAQKGQGGGPKPQVVRVEEFLARELPPRENVLAPIIPTQGLVMVYAARGVGKTHVSLGIAFAVASASGFLQWEAPEARGVLFLDGEMPAAVLQERLAHIAAAADNDTQAPLHILTPDLQDGWLPDLADPADQAALEPFLEEVELVVVDNLSTLIRTGKENESEGWRPVQQWILRLRAAGKSVLLVHHAGKGGQQRGASKKEDILDTVINLQRPAEYTPDQGAVFEVHLEKARGLYGDDAQPFEARLEERDGLAIWTTQPLAEATHEKVIRLADEGLSQKEIAEELGINKATVSRHLKRAKANGEIQEGNHEQ